MWLYRAMYKCTDCEGLTVRPCYLQVTVHSFGKNNTF